MWEVYIFKTMVMLIKTGGVVYSEEHGNILVDGSLQVIMVQQLGDFYAEENYSNIYSLWWQCISGVQL